MRAILRFHVDAHPGEPIQAVEMPEGATYLDAEPSRQGGINLWALVPDTEAPETVSKFAFAPTGAELPDGARHLRTFHLQHGALHLLALD